MKKVLTLILSFALLCTLLFTFPAFGTSDESTVPTVFEEPVSETQTENETTPPPPPTTLSNAAPIPRAELNTNYAADIKSIASSNISHNELVELARQCSTAHITLDANDSCETVTFVGTGSTRTHLNITKPCEANKVVLIEFDGYATNTEYDPTLSTGGMVITEFLDSNQNLIGSKYNGSVLGKTRCGYHRYGYISPKGTRYLRVRFATRGSTTIMLKNFSLEVLNQYQKRNNDNGIIYDGHLGMTLAAPQNTITSFELAKIAGFSSVITNVNLTKDRVMVALHDDTINATSDGAGNVRDFTYDQLQNYDFGKWFNKAYTGTKIPKLEEVIQTASCSGMQIILRMPYWNNSEYDAEMDAISFYMQKYGQRKFGIKAFQRNVLEYCYSKFGDNAYYIYCAEPTTKNINWCAAFQGDITLEMPYADASLALIPEESCLAAVSAGVKLSAYTVNDIPTMKALFKRGVTRFCTDTFSDIVFPVD